MSRGIRLAPRPANGWSAADRELLRGNLAAADRYLTGAPDAPAMPNILGLFGHHPALAARWLGFSSALLENSALEPQDRELVILRVAWRMQCRYEWAQHVGIGRSAGLTDAEVAESGAADTASWPVERRDLLEAVDQLVEWHRVDDPTWDRLAARYDEHQLLELLFLIGGYTCLALVLNGAGVEPDAAPDGDQRDLPGLEV